METKICSKCNEELKIILFNFKNKKAGIRRAECKECFNQLTRKHYENNKEYYRQIVINKREKNRDFIKSILINSSCIDCNNNDWRVLEFDHVMGTKIESVCKMSNQMASIKKLEEEIKKCEIRCSNCHKIVTYQRQNSRRAK